VRSVIAASLVPGVLVLALALWAVREAGVPAPARSTARASAQVTPPVVFGITAFYLLRLPETLIILRAQDLGVAVVVVPLLWAAVHVVKSVTSFLGGSASDRIGPERTMWSGWVCYAVLAAGMGAAHSSAAAWGLFLALGVVAGLTEGPERALVARLAGARQGSGFGSYHGITGLAALVGGLGLGALYQLKGGAVAFFVSATAGVVVAVAGLVTTVRRPTPP
jgi:sugar phosphate permease